MAQSCETQTMTSLIAQSQLPAVGQTSVLQNQVPKFGTIIPSRIFVGGIPPNSSESDLKLFFSPNGPIKDCKIISDRSSLNKGSYGFVTFENSEDADNILKREKTEDFIFKDRKLNIGPAIRKQAVSSPPSQLRIGDPISSGVLYSNGIPYTYQNGMAVFHSPEGYSTVQPTPPTTPYAQTMMTVPAGQMFLSQAAYGYAQQTPTAQNTTSWPHTAASNAWQWTPQSPVTPSLGTSQIIYPLQTQEIVYAPISQNAYPSADISSVTPAVNPPQASSVSSDQPSSDGEGSIAMDTGSLLTQAYNETAQRMQAEINQQIAHLQQLQQYQLQHLQPQLAQPTSAAGIPQLLQPMSVSTNLTGALNYDTRTTVPTTTATTLAANSYKRSHQYSTVNGGTLAFSPRIAPPVKIAALSGHRILKNSNGTPLTIISDHYGDSADVGHLLTPPRTPICNDLVN